MRLGTRRSRKLRGIDVAAGLVARLAPRALRPAIDQLRLDAGAVLDDLRGQAAPIVSTPSRPPSAPVRLDQIDLVEALLPRSLRAPYASLARDLRSVGRDLRGEARSPVVRRRSAPPPVGAAKPGPLTFRRARVTRVRPQNEEAASIELDVELAFEPGQFLTVELAVDGQTLRRVYSISSLPGEPLTITVRRLPGGRASGFLVDRLREGDALGVLGPSGSFVARPSVRRALLVAGGSGITPCWALARSILGRHADAEVTLVHGCRSEGSAIFARAIDAWAERDRRLSVVRVFSEGAEPRGSRLLAALASLGADPALEAFVAGPDGMVDAVTAALRARGHRAVHTEHFRGGPVAAATERAERVVLRHRGAEHAVVVPPGRTVLEAATLAGVALPFSCALGGCGACAGRLVEGDVRMDEPHCLSPEERARGRVLTCVGRPFGPSVIEVP